MKLSLRAQQQHPEYAQVNEQWKNTENSIEVKQSTTCVAQ